MKKKVESKIIKMFDREWKWIKKKYQSDESKMMKIYEREEKWRKNKQQRGIKDGKKGLKYE